MKLILIFVIALSQAQKNPREVNVISKVKFTVKIGDNEGLEPIVIGLFDEEVPETVKNFTTICSPGVKNGENMISYSQSIFHRVIPQFMI